MKRVVSLLLCLMMVASLTACGGEKTTETSSNDGATKTETTDIVTGMIAYSFGTQSFSDDVLAGLVKAEEELQIPHYELEIADVTETASGFRTLIQQGVNFVVATTAEYCDGMLEVANEYPDVYFLYLAEYLEDAPENVISFEYRENEAAFLAGALGALLTGNNKIGAVLAVTDPIQLRYQYGYMAGAKAINPECEVMVTFTNSYADTNIGYEHASAMYSQGCDYVGCYAGACNLGVFQAAEEAGAEKYCFGAANGQFDKCHDKIVASVVKPIDEAIVALLRDGLENGKFDTSISSLGLKEGGVKLLFTDNQELLSMVGDENMAIIDDLKEKIVSGELIVPATEEEWNSFDYTY